MTDDDKNEIIPARFLGDLGRDATRAELSAAFDRVSNKENWKFDIDATIDSTPKEVNVIRSAITFFSGSNPTIIYKKEIGKAADGVSWICRWHIKADGYYKTIGS